MTIIFVRRHSPIQIQNETHSLLLISYLTAAADIVDFADYSNHEIISQHVGIEIIWSKLLSLKIIKAQIFLFWLLKNNFSFSNDKFNTVFICVNI